MKKLIIKAMILLLICVLLTVTVSAAVDHSSHYDLYLIGGFSYDDSNPKNSYVDVNYSYTQDGDHYYGYRTRLAAEAWSEYDHSPIRMHRVDDEEACEKECYTEIALHELGHALGLDHYDDCAREVMQPSHTGIHYSGGAITEPYIGDKAGIADKY